MITQYILLVLGIAALLAALVLLFRPWRWLVAAIPAFVGLVLLHMSYFIAVKSGTFIFWGICTALVNQAALQLFSKAGFRQQAQLKDWLFDGTEYHEAVVMQMVL